MRDGISYKPYFLEQWIMINGISILQFGAIGRMSMSNILVNYSKTEQNIYDILKNSSCCTPPVCYSQAANFNKNFFTILSMLEKVLEDESNAYNGTIGKSPLLRLGENPVFLEGVLVGFFRDFFRISWDFQFLFFPLSILTI